MINIKSKDFLRSNFNYEEDDYDKLKNIIKTKDNYRVFTNKSTKKKTEFDYEEDPYEPEKNY